MVRAGHDIDREPTPHPKEGPRKFRSPSSRGSPFGKTKYLQTLQMMFELLTKARKEGLVAVEQDVESPAQSQFFRSILIS